jgi:hypothetical protein
MQMNIKVMPNSTPRKDRYSSLLASSANQSPVSSNLASPSSCILAQGTSRLDFQPAALTGIGHHLDSNLDRPLPSYTAHSVGGHVTRLQDVKGDLGTVVDAEPTHRDYAHRRSFFCRTSSSAYSVQHDQDEAVQWCQYDNAVYGGMGHT